MVTKLVTKFWELVATEHGVSHDGSYAGTNDEQLSQIGVYFSESNNGKYIPRACLFDLEPGTIEAVKATPFGAMFRPDNMANAHIGAGNNWA